MSEQTSRPRRRLTRRRLLQLAMASAGTAWALMTPGRRRRRARPAAADQRREPPRWIGHA